MPDYSPPLYWRGHRFLVEHRPLAHALKRAERGATATEFLDAALSGRDAAVLFSTRPTADELSALAALLYDDARDLYPASHNDQMS